MNLKFSHLMVIHLSALCFCGLAGCDVLGVVAGFLPESPEQWRIAQFETGDYWTYDYTVNNGDGIDRTATVTETMLDKTMTDAAGTEVAVMGMHGELVLEDGTVSTYDTYYYLSQDEQGNWYFHGEQVGSSDSPGSYDLFISADSGGSYPEFPNPLIVGAACAWNVTYEDGAQFEGQHVVVAHETITLPIGSYEAAKVEFQQTYRGEQWTTTITGQYWFVPALVRRAITEATYMEQHNTEDEKFEYTYRYEMKDTNLINDR